MNQAHEYIVEYTNGKSESVYSTSLGNLMGILRKRELVYAINKVFKRYTVNELVFDIKDKV